MGTSHHVITCEVQHFGFAMVNQDVIEAGIIRKLEMRRKAAFSALPYIRHVN